MTTPTLLFTIVLLILLIFLRDDYAILPFIVAACFIPADQRIIILGLDFTPLRFLVVAGYIRLLPAHKRININLNFFDKLVLTWAFCGALVYTLQWASTRALIYKSGVLFDVIGLYFLFRLYICSWKRIDFIIRSFAIFAIISAVLVVYERVAHNNPFDFLGRAASGMHHGRYRCAGAFPHYIIFGLFWVNLIPFFLAYAISEPIKRVYWIGAVFACIIISYISASSTPILTMAAIFFFFCLFRFRIYGRPFVLISIASLTALHIVMKKPVWHLICRVGVFSGSTGWHRYHLIDQAIQHFNEWALLGTRSTTHWGWHLRDITNQFVLEGTRGGVITLLVFVSLLGVAVKMSGSYSLRGVPRGRQYVTWAICVAIIGHCISFIGVSYFGQIMMLLYLHLAMVGYTYELDSKRCSKTVLQLTRNNQKQYGECGY